ncbi:protein NO VEIN domain-containing protein [Lactobacillus psittaci]|uniref:Protein NO VEIN C-terminal domain-containing protein n=1 Tax=Lactobacillus psittaci DSM 15354 TaxID=1122152 RepID=A0A0R1S8Q9_9LACO|nr:DUF3883 domain-containing protein [Lactobacillus psittaci]KRL63074.1 hypothetical protein FC23_GL001013 [Lactobacillus psittaci DSM 15354]
MDQNKVTVAEFLNSQKVYPTGYYILDTAGEKTNHFADADKDYIEYSYNVGRYNKLKVGSVFLYRRTTSTTKEGKFKFDGGGIISAISEPDNEKNVVAKITNAFIFDHPIMQGDPGLEQMTWESKKKKVPGKWSHFWNQYGMQEISERDFQNLTANHLVKPLVKAFSPKATFSAETISSMMTLTIYQMNQEHQFVCHTEKIANDLSFAKNEIVAGQLGKELVYRWLCKKAVETGSKRPEIIDGKSAGDIRYFDRDGKRKIVVVKTTIASYVDKFSLNSVELKLLARKPEDFEVFRVFNLDRNHLAYADIAIYQNLCDNKNFVQVPTRVRVELNREKK